MPELIIHILNYRTPQLTIDCLNTLQAERSSYSDFKVYLLDNASGDDSVPLLEKCIQEKQWDNWVHFISLDKNIGFAGGNNHIITLALNEQPETPFHLLLNSDTLVHEGCLATSIEWMKAHPKTGAFSCMLRNQDGTVQNVCRKFPRPDRETVRALGLPYVMPKLFAWADLEDPGWDRESTSSQKVEWIGGAFMLLRTEAIQQAGVMNEDFFFYGEDCEWCFRLHKNGWDIHFDPTPSITHLGGASSDSTRLLDKRREILTWKARFLVQRSCYGKIAELWIRAMYIYAFAMRCIWLKMSGQGKSLKYESIRSGLHTLTHPLDPERI
jgi:GT2 family glycosyltransferase